MDKDESSGDGRFFHIPEDVMMRNQVLHLRIRELEKRIKEIEEIGETNGKSQPPAQSEVDGLRERLSLVEGEKRILAQRVSSAYIVLYDYDGYYNPKTKKGNVEGLASVVDIALGILSGSEDNLKWEGTNGNASGAD